VSLAVACWRDGSNSADVTLKVSPAAAKLGISRTVLDDGSSEGLSGLAVDEHGDFLAVSERHRFLVRFHSDAAGFRTDPQRIALTGVGDGLDTESIAFIRPGYYAIGTERHEGREQDAVLFIELTGSEGRVVDEARLDYGAWKQRAGINAGIEALCFAAGSLVLGSEVVVTDHAKRFALIARYNISAKAWSYGRLRLTSDAGKLSSIECRDGANGAIETIGIERHFGVGRIIRFDVPREGDIGDLQPHVALDLIPLIQPLPNYEGITWNARGDLVLLTDNSYVIVDKPSEVMVVPKSALAAP
jgi:hypothetical protein